MRKAVFVFSVGVSLGLVACAGTVIRSDSKSKTSVTSDEIDASKVATVNRWALDHGAKLIWLNYPQKHQVTDDGHGS